MPPFSMFGFRATATPPTRRGSTTSDDDVQTECTINNRLAHTRTYIDKNATIYKYIWDA